VACLSRFFGEDGARRRHHQHSQREQRALEALAVSAHRCPVPFTSFSEYDTIDGKKTPVWFAPDDGRSSYSQAS
jgi:putative SOS response-associated peptidase YedK